MPAELPLPYVPIKPDIREHPKTRKFLRALGKGDDRLAHIHVIEFLLAVGRLHPNGKLGRLEDEDLAEMGLWPGDPKAFAEALVRSGWVLIGDGGYVVVGWEEYGGRVLAEREQWRERQRRRRESKKSPGPLPDSDVTHGDVTVTSPGDPVTSAGGHVLKVKGEGEDLVVVGAHAPRRIEDIEGDSTERCISVSALNRACEQSWAKSIPPKWFPGFYELEPFSPAELRVARQRVLEACAPDGDPNPGLLLSKLKEGRREARPRTREPPRAVSKQDQSFEAAVQGMEAWNATR
jgi:hypothetical protein